MKHDSELSEIYGPGYYTVTLCIDDGTWTQAIICLPHTVTRDALRLLLWTSTEFGTVVDICDPMETTLDDADAAPYVTTIGLEILEVPFGSDQDPA